LDFKDLTDREKALICFASKNAIDYFVNADISGKSDSMLLGYILALTKCLIRAGLESTNMVEQALDMGKMLVAYNHIDVDELMKDVWVDVDEKGKDSKVEEFDENGNGKYV
jgi:hypothetical protein